jgi:hypothetical protein
MPSLADTIIRNGMTEREQRIADTERLHPQAAAVLLVLAHELDAMEAVYRDHVDAGDSVAPLLKITLDHLVVSFDHAFAALEEEGLL